MNLFKLTCLIGLSSFFLTSCESLDFNSFSSLFKKKDNGIREYSSGVREYTTVDAVMEDHFKPYCDTGDLSACNMLSEYYFYNKNNKETAYQLTEKACLNQNKEGCYLNTKFLISDGRLSSEKEVENALKEYCQTGIKDGEACRLLGGYFLEKTPKDKNKATKYLSLGCEKKDSKSCSTLTLLSLDNDNSNKQKNREYVQKLEELCNKQNDGKSCAALSGLYLTGYKNIVLKSPGLAYTYGSKACGLNESYACGIMGILYYKGAATTQSNKEAVRYWEKALSLGNDYDSLVNLGYFYLNGIEVSKDKSKAKILYQYACKINPEQKEDFEEFSTYGKTACEVANEL